MRLYYCKKCGRRVILASWDENVCDCCDSKAYKVPDEYLIVHEGKLYEHAFNKDLEQQFIDECIKSSPEFGQYLFDHRDEYLARKSDENRSALAMGEAILNGRDKGNSYGVECPYCHATNVKKISNLSKAGSAALWGIFAMGKVSKQWHCNKCGSDF